MGVAFLKRETILKRVTMSTKLLSSLFSFGGEVCLDAAMSHPKRSRGFLGLVFMS